MVLVTASGFNLVAMVCSESYVYNRSTRHFDVHSHMTSSSSSSAAAAAAAGSSDSRIGCTLFGVLMVDACFEAYNSVRMYDRLYYRVPWLTHAAFLFISVPQSSEGEIFTTEPPSPTVHAYLFTTQLRYTVYSRIIMLLILTRKNMWSTVPTYYATVRLQLRNKHNRNLNTDLSN